jgi:hypothetical protein
MLFDHSSKLSVQIIRKRKPLSFKSKSFGSLEGMRKPVIKQETLWPKKAQQLLRNNTL